MEHSFANRLLVSGGLAVAVLLFAARPCAALPIIVQPVGATSPSTSFNTLRTPTEAINGSGLSSALTTGSAIPLTYPTHNTGGDNSLWMANGTTTSIVFDLGAVYDNLVGFHVWNHNQTGNTIRSMRNVDVSFSAASSTGPFINAISYTGATEFAQAPGNVNYTGEDKLLGDFTTARWVRFDILQNWGDASFVGMSEIRFFTDDIPLPVVPEPSTLLLLGAGIAGMAWRRRKVR